MKKPSINVLKNGDWEELKVNFLNENTIPSDFSYSGNYLRIDNCTIPSDFSYSGNYLRIYNCTIPSDFSYSGNDLYIYNCTIPERIEINNKKYEFVKFDGITSILISHRKKGDVEIFKCREPEFKNKKLIGKVHYIVKENNLSAHGDNLKEALEDLDFKGIDREEAIKEYKNLKMSDSKPLQEWINCYRIITGACRYGVQMFLENITPKKKYTLKEVIELTRRQYGHNPFIKFFGGMND